MIKTTVIDEEKEVKSFPKLMRDRNTGIIVLFYDKTEGIVLSETKASLASVGNSAKDYNILYFEDYEGSITISNF